MDTSLTQYPVIQVKTLRFEYLIIFLNSYAPQIWTQPYYHHIIRKYKLTLPIFMKKTYFFHFQFRWKKTSRMKKIQEIVININKCHYMKDHDFRKVEKKEPSNLEFL